MSEEYQGDASSSQGDITQLLHRVEKGESDAAAELFERIYPELRRTAESHMRGQNKGHTLQPTALVNEAFLKLAGKGCPAQPTFQDRRHFFLTASKAMRHILIDHARSKRALKRDRARAHEELDTLAPDVTDAPYDLEALELALQKLELRDPQMAKAIELRFFIGFNNAETAELLQTPLRTFERRWGATKDWLKGVIA